MKKTDKNIRFDLSDEEISVLSVDEMKNFIAALRYERTQFIQDIQLITARMERRRLADSDGYQCVPV